MLLCLCNISRVSFVFLLFLPSKWFTLVFLFYLHSNLTRKYYGHHLQVGKSKFADIKQFACASHEVYNHLGQAPNRSFWLWNSELKTCEKGALQQVRDITVLCIYKVIELKHT